MTIKLDPDIVAWLNSYANLNGINDPIPVLLRKVVNRYTPQDAPKPPT